MTVDPEQVAKRCNHYGGLFIGQLSAEVFGDYGIGPNHVSVTFVVEHVVARPLWTYWR